MAGGGGIAQVLKYADNVVLVTEIREHPQHIGKEYERMSDRMKLKTNVGKSKVLVVKKDQRGSCEKVGVNGEEMQEVNELKYLGGVINADRGTGEEVSHRVLEERRVGGDNNGKVMKEEYDI